MSLLGLGLVLYNVTSGLVRDSSSLVNDSSNLFNASATFDNGGCPSPSDYPVMPYGYNKYACAYIFKGEGNDDPSLACNGYSYGHLDGTTDPGETGYHWPVGSLIVKAGCKLWGYELENYKGGWRWYSGPSVTPKKPFLWNYGPTIYGYKSFSCECSIHYIDCSPADMLIQVLKCDNRNSLFEKTCSYTQTIGTDYSSLMQESMGIHSTIKDFLSSTFFAKFRDNLGVSHTTEYDWRSVNTQVKNPVVRQTQSEKVGPGELLIVRQVIGTCTDGTVYTDKFESTLTPGPTTTTTRTTTTSGAHLNANRNIAFNFVVNFIVSLVAMQVVLH